MSFIIWEDPANDDQSVQTVTQFGHHKSTSKPENLRWAQTVPMEETVARFDGTRCTDGAGARAQSTHVRHMPGEHSF